MSRTDASALAELTLERNFLVHILALIEEDDPATFADLALGEIVTLVGARRGYLALSAPPDDALEKPAWSATRGFEDDSAPRELMSATVVASALRSGQTVHTGSAQQDERFSAADSVRRHGIEAVLCVPIGRPDSAAFGILYLQGSTSGDEPRFSTQARHMAERLAHHLAPVSHHIVRAAAPHAADPTTPWRARLNGADPLVGKSPALADAFKNATLVAPLDVPVLITGPSGTGKTALARLIARAGKRAARPFVELNCATLPEALFESELFGALPGAHSTATKKIVGKVEAAEGGTLFLDEIGELSQGVQAKLLQLLSDHRYFPLGASTPREADLRIIAATNVDLAAKVAAGQFREDLFYRLHVIPIRMPGLDERRSDIPLLAESFLTVASDRHGLGTLSLSAAARSAIERADWPGHVRELQHAVEAAAIRAHGEGTQRVEPAHLFPAAPASPTSGRADWHASLKAFQRGLMEEALAATGGSVPEAAKRLGIARSHAYELVRLLGLR
jgi:DNA-binding NtrC family response regulator